jgi:integrase
MMIRLYLNRYLDFVNWKIDKGKTLDYIKMIREKYNVSYYRKHVYQIRKFLKHSGVEWSEQLQPPNEPEYTAKRVPVEDVKNTLTHFKGHPYYPQIKALVLLGSTSGMRAKEMFQLKIKDIDLENKTVHINHDPHNGQTTKTKHSRVTFFTNETKEALQEYFVFYKEHPQLQYLFNQSHLLKIFIRNPVRVKDCRKAFSQIWDKQGGQTTIKQLLMGHSTKSSVDLQHYYGQSIEDLKQIYEKVMGDYKIQG